MNIDLTVYPEYALFSMYEGSAFVGVCSLERPEALPLTLTFFPYNYAYFYNFDVIAEHRGKGYGKALFQSTLNYAKKQNYPGVWWYTDENHVDLALPHHRLYNQYAVKIEDTSLWYVEL